MFALEIPFASPRYDETIVLRDAILRKPLKLTFTPEDLALEYNQFHLACFSERWEILGCLVLKPRDKGAIQMRQVAVRNDIQSKGIGSFLVRECETLAKREGFNKMILNARETALNFYKRNGYTQVGKRFEEVGIPHFAMEKELT